MKETIPYQPEFDSIDWRTGIRRSRHAIVSHIPLILTSCAVALVLLVLYMKIFPPIYKAEAVVMGESSDDVVRSNYYAHWNVFRRGDLKSEPELLTSGRVARQVVTALNLKFDDVHHTFLTHVGYLWTESWVGKRYRAFKEWLWPPDPRAYKATPEEIEFARTVDAFRDGISVESVPGTAIGRVVVKAPSFRAAQIANAAVDIYLKERANMFHSEAQTAYKSLESEVARAAVDLAEIDRRKFEFEQRNKVVLDFEKDKLLVSSWATLQTTVKDLKGTVASLEASLQVVEQQLAVEPPEVISGRSFQDSKTKSLLQSRVFELNANLLQSREKYVASSPEVVELTKLLEETRAMLKSQPDRIETGQERVVNPVYTELRQKQNNLRTQLASAKAMLASKQVPMEELEARMALVPSLVKNVIEQGRIREGLEMRYKLLRDRMMQADVSRATVGSAPASVRVIDYANPPMKPVWPRNIILVPSALAAGLVVGVLLAMLAEALSPRVNRDRLTSRPDIPVYAVIDLRAQVVPALAGPETQAGHTPAIERLRRPG